VNPIRPRILYRTDENTPTRRYADFFATQLAIVKSAEVLNRCLNDPAVSDAPLLVGVDDPVRALRDTLEVQRLERTQLFSVSVRGAKAQGLARIVNGAVRAYLGYLDEADSTSQNRRVQLLDAERRKLKDDVELKADALAKLRAMIGADPNAAPGVLYRDPVDIAYEALVDIRTRRAPLKARLSTLQAKLKSADVRVPGGQIEEAVDRDPQVQRLTGLRDQLRRELLSAEIETISPPPAAVRARVRMELEIRALNKDIVQEKVELPDLRNKAIEDIKKDAEQRAKELRTQLQSVEKQIEEQREQARSGIVQRLKKNARDSVRREIENLKAELAALDTNESALKGMLKDQAKRRKDTDRNAAELSAREEAVQRTQQTLRDVEQRLHELEVEARAPGYISIASYATEPVTPEAYVARRVKYSIVGVIAAAGLALLVMVLLRLRGKHI